MALTPKNVGQGLFRGTPVAVSVGVAAFGKHPAYADHLPLDVGDQSPLASRLRQTLYNGGILTRIAEFDTLQKAGRAIPFAHFIFYHESDGTPANDAAALVRLWASRDSVDRADCPMVLAACGTGAPAAWILNNAASILTAAQQRCLAAARLDDLTAAVAIASTELRAAADVIAGPNSTPPVDDRQFPNPSSISPALIASLRAIREYLPMDGPSKFTMPDRPAAARVTSLGLPPHAAIATWSLLLDTALAARTVRYMIVAPDNSPWVDLLIGEPAPKHFVCLRAGPAALPVVAPAADELTSDFGRSALAWLEKIAGREPVVAPGEPPRPAPQAPAGSPPWMLIASAAVVIAAAAIGGILYLRGSPAPTPVAVAPPDQPPATQAVAAPPQPPQQPPPQPPPVVAPSPVIATPPPPTPAPPPPAPLEPDPRQNWNTAGLKQQLADVEQIDGEVARLKDELKSIPGVAEAIKDPPPVSDIHDPTPRLLRAVWPADKANILENKSQWDKAAARAAEIKSADYPAQARNAALAALRAVKFQTPAIQDRWNNLAVMSRLQPAAAADSPLPLPEIYARFTALDKLAAAAPPDALAAELDSSVSDRSLTPAALAGDLQHRTELIAQRQAATEKAKSALATADALLIRADPTGRQLNDLVAQLSAIAAADLPPDLWKTVQGRLADIDAVNRAADAPVPDKPAAAIAAAKTPALAAAIWRVWAAANPIGRPLEEDAQVTAAIKDRTKDQLAKDIDDASKSRWIKRFDAAFAAPATPDEKNIDPLLAQRADADAIVSGPARYDLILYRYKKQMADEKADARELTKRAASDLSAAGGQADSLVQSLQKALEPPPDSGRVDGPEAAGLKRVTSDPASALVKFQTHGITLSFIRFGNTYFSADEFPAGLFVTLVNEQKWKAEDLDINVGRISDDRRLIPRSWNWNRDQSQMELNKAWLSTGDESEDAFINGKSDAVDSNSPVQYITPRAAAKIAALLGCRLPTPDEWLTAFHQGGQHALRLSAAQRAQYEKLFDTPSLAEKRKPMLYLYPWPNPASGGDNAMPRRFWFSPVKTDADAFCDLDGNLAEFAAEDADKFSVMGASQWADASVDAAVKRPLYPQNHAPTSDWADVGFRLAYTAPPAPPAAVLRKLAQDAVYLPTK